MMFLFGFLGGLLPDVLRLIKNRHKTELPAYLKSASFWIGLLLLVGTGGLAAYLMQADTIKDALIYGYTAPQVFSSLVGGASANKEEEAARSRGLFDESHREEKQTLLNWWSS